MRRHGMRRYVAFRCARRLVILSSPRSVMEEAAMRYATPLVIALAATTPGTALAACGSAFCTVNTDWASQGEWTETGGRLDLRYEFIDQKQPRNGAEAVAVGQVPQHHDEVRTINRNYIGMFDYNF